MKMLSDDEIFQLESQIDDCGLSEVIEMLGMICFEKADHVRSNWQDNALAKVWDRAAEKLGHLSARLNERGL